MTAVWILATIFAFIIITTYISEKEKTKRQKMKIEATLRSEEMARLYRSCLVEGPVEYTESIFAEMAAKGRLCGGEPRQLALEFYAPMLLLISVSDLTGESQRDALRRHVESFVRRCSPTEN